MGPRSRFHIDPETGKIVYKASEPVKNHLEQGDWDVFTCKICKRTFFQEDQLKAHRNGCIQKGVTPVLVKVKTGEGPIPARNIGVLHRAVLKLAVKKAIQSPSLRRRVTSHPEKTRRPYRRKGPEVFCERCKIHLSSQHGLARHNASYHTFSPRKCSICDKELQTLYMLLKHEKKIHRSKLNKNRFECPKCSKVLATRSTLLSHIKKFHTKGEFKCHFCSKNLKTKVSMERHQKTKCKKKPVDFKCNVCFKVLCSFSNLKRHELIHSNNRSRAVCKSCGRTYSDSGNLARHSKKCHS